ncbi:hypothetical protein BB559_001866 [Furculomyces boomerangus]|uniref:Uncharacterized protein n=1 Tax=Furculomyces boomerangus TaxID=61424 RepID=A0A2T9YZZ2_9FUNG|nr:hypothetical protein BB559_001866 [Furculomyces boomerangus]
MSYTPTHIVGNQIRFQNFSNNNRRTSNRLNGGSMINPETSQTSTNIYSQGFSSGVLNTDERFSRKQFQAPIGVDDYRNQRSSPYTPAIGQIQQRSRGNLQDGTAYFDQNQLKQSGNQYFDSRSSAYPIDERSRIYNKNVSDDFTANEYGKGFDNYSYRPQISGWDRNGQDFTFGNRQATPNGEYSGNSFGHGIRVDTRQSALSNVASQPEQEQLPSFLLNTAMGKSPTNTKSYIGMAQSRQPSPYRQNRTNPLKRSSTPEGIPVPKSRRVMGYGSGDSTYTPRSRSSIHGSINNDELPPIVTLDDDDMLNANSRKDGELFDPESTSKINSERGLLYELQDTLGGQETPKEYFDNDWEPADVLDMSLLIFGISDSSASLITEYCEQYGPLKAVLCAPEQGNWAVIVFEYPESSEKMYLASKESNGKILVGNGRFVFGVERATTEAIDIAKAGQRHLYSKKVDPSISKLKEGSVQSNRRESINSTNLNNNLGSSQTRFAKVYKGSDSERIKSRLRHRRLGADPPRRSSLKPINKETNYSPFKFNNQVRLPFADSPARITSTPLSQIRSQSNLQGNYTPSGSSSVTPLNIKPRSGFIQTAVDMLFGW